MHAWSSGARREQLLGMGLHLDLMAVITTSLVASAAEHGRLDPARAAEDLDPVTAQLDALAHTVSAYRYELLDLASEHRRRRQESGLQSGLQSVAESGEE